MNYTKVFIIIIPVFYSISVGAQEYSRGHGALQLFDSEAIMQSPMWLKIWLGTVVTIFFSGFFFIKKNIEPKLAIGGFLLVPVADFLTTKLFALPPLSGKIALLHLIFWTPAFITLLKNRPFLKELGPFSIWSGILTATMIISFIFDIRDTVIYLLHF